MTGDSPSGWLRLTHQKDLERAAHPPQVIEVTVTTGLSFPVTVTVTGPVEQFVPATAQG